MLTDKQEKIKNRREVIKQARELLKDEDGVTPLVNYLAKRFKVSTVTIFNDMKFLGLTVPKSRKQTA